MRTRAKVVATDGDYAIVACDRRSACDGCHKKAEGEFSVCSLMGSGRTMNARAYNAAGAQVGDTVELETASSRVLGYAALVFLAPVALGVLFYALFSLINTLTAGIMAAVGFILPLICAAIIDRIGRDSRLPVITEIVLTDVQTSPCESPDGDI